MIFLLLIFVYFVTTAFSSPIDPHLVCEEKRWKSILIFFTTNYIAHALTIIPDPGANWFAQTVFSFSALMVPNIGLIGAIRSVTWYLLQGRSDDLHRALAQNALLILVRKVDMRPQYGDIEIKINSTFSFHSRQVHGEITIPDDYALIVPSQHQHLNEMKPALRESRGIKLCRSIEVTSAVVGIGQVIFSSITIYRARGDQIEKYGYAAYGLSVYSYLLMSGANLIKLAVCGRYPYAYVLRTATLVDLERANSGVFKGAVGNFGGDFQGGDSVRFSDPPLWLQYFSFSWLRPEGDYSGYRRIVPAIGSIIFIIAILSQPLFVVLLSGFNDGQNIRGQKFLMANAGQSTRLQRIWMLGWLIANIYSAPLVHFVASSGRGLGGRNAKDPVGFASYVFVIFAYVFAFGGFVTVGGMLHAEISYQLC